MIYILKIIIIKILNNLKNYYTKLVKKFIPEYIYW